MSWGTIRKATSTDITRLEEAAERFCERHKIPNYDVLDDGPWVKAVVVFLADSSDRHRSYLGRLWRRIVRRALQEPNAEGIAYGYVGYYCT